MTKPISQRVAGFDLEFTKTSPIGQAFDKWQAEREQHQARRTLLTQRERELADVKQALHDVSGDSDPSTVVDVLGKQTALKMLVVNLRRDVRRSAGKEQASKGALSALARRVADDLAQIARLDDPAERVGNLSPDERVERAEQLRQAVYETSGVKSNGRE